jgi:hypothetical protein
VPADSLPVPDAPVAATGEFDSETQVAAEQAASSGIVFPGLCRLEQSGVDPQGSLALVIAVPMAATAVMLLLLTGLLAVLQDARTPFDGGSGSGAALGDPALELPEDLYNSVEDTSALSEYARSDAERSRNDEATAADASETSGIWADDQ